MAEHLSKLSEKCKACSKVNECNYKKIELCAVAELPPQINIEASQGIMESATMPLMREEIKSPLSPFKYKDEIEKALHKELYNYLYYGA